MPADETTLLSQHNLSDDAGNAAANTAFLLLETNEYIAEHWKGIFFIGVFNVITGTGCLMNPIFSTQVVELFLVMLVLGSGILNIMAVVCGGGTVGSDDDDSFYSPRHRRSPLFWVGFSQVLLAILMYLNPFVTLTILTFFVAVIFMLMGSIQFALARQQNHGRIAARALMMTSGLMAVLVSIIICLTMDTAKWYAIGVLMGVNLVNIGTNRILVGLYGRKLSQPDGSEESWRSVLDADFV